MIQLSPRFSFSKTDISELDIESLLENSISLAQVLPQSRVDACYSPPHSPVDGTFDDLPALSPEKTPCDDPASLYSESPDTPLASGQRQNSLRRSPRTEALSSYSFPAQTNTPSSSSDSRSSTPTPILEYSLPPIPLKCNQSRSAKHASTIMVELDDFFPHKPSNTFTPFRAFHARLNPPHLVPPPSFPLSPELQSTAELGSDESQGRKGSLASSLFSLASSSSSTYSSDSSSTDTRLRTRTRSRSVSGKSMRTTTSGTTSIGATGGTEFGQIRQPKLAAYPRYVPPKCTQQITTSSHGGDGTIGRKFKLFGGGK